MSLNFISGLIEVVGCFLGNVITKYIPSMILLTTLSGIGLAYLSIGPFINMLAVPITTYIPIIIVFLWFYCQVKFWKIPPAVIALIFGSILAWIEGLNDTDKVKAAVDHIGQINMKFNLVEIFKSLPETKNYLNIIFPVAISNFLETMQNVKAASLAGDT